MTRCCCIFVFFSLLLLRFIEGTFTASVPMQTGWNSRTGFPGAGRHHPITFANATHGFVLTGSTTENPFMNDFWIYDESSDNWTDLSSTTSAFPGRARSFGYGVASGQTSKAYLGFGAAESYQMLNDWWEFDMSTHAWKQLAEFPGQGRRHPAMNFLRDDEIHVGLGDGVGGNYNDWWMYDIATDSWRQLPDFPGSKRHHPFFFTIGSDSYAGLGHSDGFEPYIERDWYRYIASNATWIREPDFASYALVGDGPVTSEPVTTEARVAGTEFSVTVGHKTLGFVLSGDGDDHGTMATGEFHMYDPSEGGIWRQLPPHPGVSRWAPGSFVMQGTARAYFFGGYDREQNILHADLWRIDLASLFESFARETSTPTATPAANPTAAPASVTESLNEADETDTESDSFSISTATDETTLTSDSISNEPIQEESFSSSNASSRKYGILAFFITELAVCLLWFLIP